MGGPSRRPAARGCAGLEAGVPVPLRHRGLRGPRREGNRPDAGGSVPPPRFAGLCRPGGRRFRAVATPRLVGFPPRGEPSRHWGSAPPPACGGLCRPGGRRSRAVATPRLLRSSPRGEPSRRWGVRPAAPLRGAVPAWRPAFPSPCAVGLWRGPSRRPAARGCAGLEAGVPVPVRRRAMGGPSRRPAARGCAGLEAGVPVARAPSGYGGVRPAARASVSVTRACRDRMAFPPCRSRSAPTGRPGPRWGRSLRYPGSACGDTRASRRDSSATRPSPGTGRG